MISFDDYGGSDNNINLSPIYNSLSTINEYISTLSNNIVNNYYTTFSYDSLINSGTIMSISRPYLQTFTPSDGIYQYNISGDVNVSDLASIAIIHGDVNSFVGSEISNIDKLEVKNVNTIKNINFNVSDILINGNDFESNILTNGVNNISLQIDSCKGNNFNSNIMNNISFVSLFNNTFSNINDLRLNGKFMTANKCVVSKLNADAFTLLTNTLDANALNVSFYSATKNSFSNFIGHINGVRMNSNTFKGVVDDINAYAMYGNSMALDDLNIVADTFTGNTGTISVMFGVNGYYQKNLLNHFDLQLIGVKMDNNTLNIYGILDCDFDSISHNEITNTIGDIKALSIMTNSFKNYYLQLKANTINSNLLSADRLELSGGKAENNDIKCKVMKADFFTFQNNTISETSHGYYDISAVSFNNNSTITYNSGEYNSLFAMSAQSNDFVASLGYYNIYTLHDNNFKYGTLNINIDSATNNTFSWQNHLNITGNQIQSNVFSDINIVDLNVNSLNSLNSFNSISKLYLKYNLHNQQQTFNDIKSLYTPDYFTSSDNSYSVSKFYIENIDSLFDTAGSYTFSEDISKMYAQYVPFSLLKPGNVISPDYMKTFNSSDGNYQYNISGICPGSTTTMINVSGDILNILGNYTLKDLDTLKSYSQVNLKCDLMSSCVFDKSVSNFNITANVIEGCNFLLTYPQFNITANAASNGMLCAYNANININTLSRFSPISIKNNALISCNSISGLNLYSGNRTMYVNEIQSLTVQYGNLANINVINGISNLTLNRVSTAKINCNWLDGGEIYSINSLKLNTPDDFIVGLKIHDVSSAKINCSAIAYPLLDEFKYSGIGNMTITGNLENMNFYRISELVIENATLNKCTFDFITSLKLKNVSINDNVLINMISNCDLYDVNEINTDGLTLSNISYLKYPRFNTLSMNINMSDSKISFIDFKSIDFDRINVIKVHYSTMTHFHFTATKSNCYYNGCNWYMFETYSSN